MAYIICSIIDSILLLVNTIILITAITTVLACKYCRCCKRCKCQRANSSNNHDQDRSELSTGPCYEEVEEGKAGERGIQLKGNQAYGSSVTATELKKLEIT